MGKITSLIDLKINCNDMNNDLSRGILDNVSQTYSKDFVITNALTNASFWQAIFGELINVVYE